MSLDVGTTLGGSIHGILWDARLKHDAPVGTCVCGGKMYGLPVRLVGRRRWYDTECRACGRETSTPDTRTSVEQIIAA